jgi:hypothetical protein
MILNIKDCYRQENIRECNTNDRDIVLNKFSFTQVEAFPH